MANIDKELRDIKNAVYGREVRGSIHDGINKINKESEGSRQIATNTEQRQDAVEQQFNNLLSEWSDERPIDNAETIAARTNTKESKTYENLGKRLDEEYGKVKTQLAQTRNLVDYDIGAKGRKKEGITVFISDDGLVEDYEFLKPIFEAEGVPLCVAIVGERPDQQDRAMTSEQLRELQNDLGWEIMSHSQTHPHLNELSESEAIYELEESKKTLESMGLNVQGFAFPFGSYSTRERRLVERYYRYARISSYWNTNIQPYETFELKTYWLDPSEAPNQYNFAFFKEKIDRARDNKELLIISTHGKEINTSDRQNTFAQVVEYANQQTKVLTLREAMNQSGNIVNVGDYTRVNDVDQNRGQEGSFFYLGANGKVDTDIIANHVDKYTLDTPFEHFPYGITTNIVTDATPLLSSGIFTTFKVRQYQGMAIGYNYQELRNMVGNMIFQRRVLGNNSYGEWELVRVTGNRKNVTTKPIYGNVQELNNEETAIIYGDPDNDSAFNIGFTNDNYRTRLIVPNYVKKVKISANLVTSTASGNLVAYLRKNGNRFRDFPIATSFVESSYHSINLNSPILDVEPGDYFELIVEHDHAGSLYVPNNNVTFNQANWLSMEVIE